MDPKAIREQLPASAEKLTSLVQSDLQGAYAEFQHDIDLLAQYNGRVANSLRLYKCIMALYEQTGKQQEDAAFQLCSVLQNPVVNEIYDQLDIISPLARNSDNLFVPLTVVVLVHMFIPQLNNKLIFSSSIELKPNSASNSPSFNSEISPPGPITFMQITRMNRSMHVDSRSLFENSIAMFNQNNLCSLIKLFTNFKACSCDLKQNPAEAMAGLNDLMHQAGVEIGSELATLALLPQLGALLNLIHSSNGAVVHSAKSFFKLVLNMGLFMVPYIDIIAENYVTEIINRAFALPEDVISRDMNRIHYDVLFEALDNSSRCFENGSFVRLLTLSTWCLENSMTCSPLGQLEYNRMISSLSPPLSSLATICHLIYEVSRKLHSPEFAIGEIDYLEDMFSRHLPPIPLRHFETKRDPQISGALEGFDFDEVSSTVLRACLNSLISILYQTLDFYGSNVHDWSVEDPGSRTKHPDVYTFNSYNMVICCLLCAVGQADGLAIEQTALMFVKANRRHALSAITEVTLQLSNQSIKMAGVGVALLARMLQIGPQQSLKDQMLHCQVAFVQLLERWYLSNADCVQSLVFHLKRLDCSDILAEVYARLGEFEQLDFGYKHQTMVLDLNALHQGNIQSDHPSQQPSNGPSQSNKPGQLWSHLPQPNRLSTRRLAGSRSVPNLVNQ